MSIFTRYILEEYEEKQKGFILEAPEDEDEETDNTGDEDSGSDYDEPEDEGNEEDTEGDNTDTQDDEDNQDNEGSEEDEENTDDSDSNYDEPEEGEEDTGEDNQENQDDEGNEEDDNQGEEESEPTDDNEENQEDDNENTLSKIEQSLFDNLSAKQKEIKISSLKKDYAELNEKIDKLYDLFNKSSVPSNVEYAIFENIKTYLLSLNQLVYDYFTNTFDTKNYLENNIQYQKFLVSLNQINSLLDELNITTKK